MKRSIDLRTFPPAHKFNLFHRSPSPLYVDINRFFFSLPFSPHSEALHAWRAKARCNIVPAERLHELFEELKFSPTEKQSKNIPANCDR